MARYTDPVCRLCRREGLKLFLKGSRCYSKKCSFEKRPTPPGQHGVRRRKVGDYGLQLREKQKVRRVYGVLEKQFRNYFIEASRNTGVTGEALLRSLELRMDNVVYRLGFAPSRAAGPADGIGITGHGLSVLRRDAAWAGSMVMVMTLPAACCDQRRFMTSTWRMPCSMARAASAAERYSPGALKARCHVPIRDRSRVVEARPGSRTQGRSCAPRALTALSMGHAHYRFLVSRPSSSAPGAGGDWCAARAPEGAAAMPGGAARLSMRRLMFSATSRRRSPLCVRSMTSRSRLTCSSVTHARVRVDAGLLDLLARAEPDPVDMRAKLLDTPGNTCSTVCCAWVFADDHHGAG